MALRQLRSVVSSGFTLVELVVVAPIIILLIGTFIGLIVNLTGEVMSSRGSNVLTFNVQDTLNRIEEDVRLSTTYLAINNIDVSDTKQGYGGTTSTGSTTNFTNVDKTGSSGSRASLILNGLVTDGSPLSSDSELVYLKDQPNPCATYAEYVKNRPMTMNVVYFIDDANTLWRRVIMPSDYANSNARCGNEPWQIPSCIYGYSALSLSFCKSNDEKLIEGVTPANFNFQYYTTASSTTPNASAVNASLSDDVRNTALQSTPTVGVTITARQTIAGRTIERTASMRATRLDTNASSIARIPTDTAAPGTPQPSAVVSDGHIVTVTWPRVANATNYSIDYQIKSNGGACDAATSGTWTTGNANLDNNNRTFTISAGDHTERVCVRTRANNTFATPSAYSTTDIVIPLWAPLILQNGWTAYGQGYNTPAYTKTKTGLVLVKGLIRKSSVVSSGEASAYLPADYRPRGGMLLFGTSASANVAARVDVAADGGILMKAGTSEGWTSLDTIRFMASTASPTIVTPSSLSNGWGNYGGPYAPASYSRDANGRVATQGLVAGGTNTDGTVIFTMASTYAPPQYLHLATQSANVFGMMGVNATPAVTAKGSGSNMWLSLNNTYMASNSGVNWTTMTLANSWVVYSGSYSTPQYTKTSDNVVQLKGLIRAGTTTAGTTLTTLPAGFRPKERILYTNATYGTYMRLDIQTNGVITFQTTANSGWISLDNVLFVAEQ